MSVKRIIIQLDRCVECDSKENIVMHHIMPESRGGKFMVPVCQPCHDKIHGCRERNISLKQLTIEGLQRAKARGVKLGTPNPEKALAAMIEANKAAKVEFAKDVEPLINDALSKDMITLQDIADHLNKNDILTRTGRKWYPNSVRRALEIQGVYNQFKSQLKKKQKTNAIHKRLQSNKHILKNMIVIMKEFNTTKLQDIADKLNERNISTTKGYKFNPSIVHNLLGLLK